MSVESNVDDIPLTDVIKIIGDKNKFGMQMSSSDRKIVDINTKVDSFDIGWIPVINTNSSDLNGLKNLFNARITKDHPNINVDGLKNETRIFIKVPDSGTPSLIILYPENTATYFKSENKFAELPLQDSITTDSAIQIKIPKDIAAETSVSNLDGLTEVYKDDSYFLELSSEEAPTKFNDGYVGNVTVVGEEEDKSTPISIGLAGQRIRRTREGWAPIDPKASTSINRSGDCFVQEVKKLFGITEGTDVEDGFIADWIGTSVGGMEENNECGTMPIHGKIAKGTGDDLPTDYSESNAARNIKIYHNNRSTTKPGAIRVTNANGTTKILCSACKASCNLGCSMSSIADKVGCVVCGDTCSGTCSRTCMSGSRATEMYGRMYYFIAQVIFFEIDLFPSLHMPFRLVELPPGASQIGDHIMYRERIYKDMNTFDCGAAKCGSTCENTCGLSCSSYCFGSCTGGCGYSCKTSCEDDSNCNYYSSNGALFSKNTPLSDHSGKNSKRPDNYGQYVTTRVSPCKWCKTTLLLFPI